MNNWQDFLTENKLDTAPVVPFDVSHQKLALLDFTTANKAITGEMLADTTSFSRHIEDMLTHQGAAYGIGGYNEHRTVYSRSRVFDAAHAQEEPRRLHLGTDIWGAADTQVMAPLEGIVHSFAFNDRFGDYGATIILGHTVNGYSFHTLYGHLSLVSLKGLYKGKRVNAGDRFAAFGEPHENGHWPPHLHFQIVLDMREYEGDYPGVCAYSEKAQWLLNSPDPDVLLRLNASIKHK